MYENELEIMKKSYYNIRGLRHDMKHHMMELKFLVKKVHTMKFYHILIAWEYLC